MGAGLYIGETPIHGVKIGIFADGIVIPSGTLNIYKNGSYDVTDYKIAEVSVSSNNVILQDKTITPLEVEQIVSPDAEYDGLNKVTISPISSMYIGSGIDRKESSDLIVEGAVVIVPPGYYSDETSASVLIVPQSTPVIDISPDGLITASSIQSAGYVGGGTKVATEQMSVQDSITVVPSSSLQTVVAAGTYVIGNVDVAAIPVSDITNSIINGASNVKEAGDSVDSFTVSVSIPEGYHSEQTLTKTFINILPELQSDATDAMILNGYEAYDDNGVRIIGSMTNNGSVNQSLNANKTSYTIPRGYHDGTGIVNHVTVNIPDPTISINASGLITASGNWDSGFTTNTNYSSTEQLATQPSKTITPSTIEQIAVSSGTYVTGDVKVAAMTDGTLAAPTINTSTGVVTAKISNGGYLAKDTSKVLNLKTQATKTVTPTKTTQTAVASGVYTTGTITVAAIPAEYITTSDANAVAENIEKDKTAYVNGSKITGTMVINKYYTGSSAPSSSLGNNGDIYIQS